MGSLRAVLPSSAVLMVDQEGGRVARLRPPNWFGHPAAGEIGALFEQDRRAGLRAAWLTGALVGLDCRKAGFDVACAPVLDSRMPGAAAVIGDRSFGEHPAAIVALARAMAAGMLAAGVQPVGKHAPGHGRARVDSHFALPVVEANDLDADLLPFAGSTDLPWMMTAHILFPAWDADRPATLSARIIGDIIRGKIGFGGVLVSDDLAMHALQGAPASRAVDCLAAGCDVALYCPGDPEGRDAVLRAVPALTDRAAERLAHAAALAQSRCLALDGVALHAERSTMLS
jgi:beta-N-acetylhexosaminidase